MSSSDIIEEITKKEEKIEIPYTPEHYLANLIEKLADRTSYTKIIDEIEDMKIKFRTETEAIKHLKERISRSDIKEFDINKIQEKKEINYASYFHTPRIEAQIAASKLLENIQNEITPFLHKVSNKKDLKDLILLNELFKTGIIKKQDTEEWDKKNKTLTQILDYLSILHQMPELETEKTQLKKQAKETEEKKYDTLLKEFFKNIRCQANKEIIEKYSNLTIEKISKEQFEETATNFIKEYGKTIKETYDKEIKKKEAENLETMTIEQTNKILNAIYIEEKVKNVDELTAIITKELEAIKNEQISSDIEKTSGTTYHFGDIIKIVKPRNGDRYDNGGHIDYIPIGTIGAIYKVEDDHVMCLTANCEDYVFHISEIEPVKVSSRGFSYYVLKSVFEKTDYSIEEIVKIVVDNILSEVKKAVESMAHVAHEEAVQTAKDKICDMYILHSDVFEKFMNDDYKYILEEYTKNDEQRIERKLEELRKDVERINGVLVKAGEIIEKF